VRRLAAVVVVALVAALFAPALASAQAGSVDPATAEREFVSRINQLRASKGLGTLTVHPELVSVARGWAASMAQADRISHNPRLAQSVAADWQKLGENVGVGMDVAKLHAAFVASPLHYKNLVDPDFTEIGVGVVIGKDGALFTAHQFMQLRGAARATKAPAVPKATATTTPPVTAPPVTAPPVTAPAPPPVAPARLVLVLEQLQALDG
jgi:hypothetical protein